MLTGAHVIIYSTDAEADRTFLREVLGLPHVDGGGGWLIFGLPPAEVAVHPADGARHELYFMCADARAFVTAMTERGILCSEVREQRWGLVTDVTLPGGSHIGVYEPKHPRPPALRD
jgi:catechol 2,3-dioxygenase-like lactoylglutathione lyase family enzyme